MQNWQWDEKNRAFAGARLDVHSLELEAGNGTTRQRETVVTADAAVIVPMLDSETVILIKNDRFAINKTIWELPAGTIEPGEDPLPAASRELAEETGYEAGNIEFLCSFYTTPGFCTENMFAYLATDLTHKGQNLDDTENISVHNLSIENVLDMIKTNEINDAKTIAALLFALKFFNLNKSMS